jgi:hypothetical protein
MVLKAWVTWPLDIDRAEVTLDLIPQSNLEPKIKEKKKKKKKKEAY